MVVLECHRHLTTGGPTGRLLHITVSRPTGYGRSTVTHGHTPRLYSPTAYRWARRSPHARGIGCTTTSTLLLMGEPAGRLIHMPVPHANDLREAVPQVAPDTWQCPTLHQPCRLQVGPQAALARGCNAMPQLFFVGGPAGRLMPVAVPLCHHSFSYVGPQAALCRWLYRHATTLSRRLARRPTHARGWTAMPPLFIVGGPAGRLMAEAGLSAQDRRVEPRSEPTRVGEESRP